MLRPHHSLPLLSGAILLTTLVGCGGGTTTSLLSSGEAGDSKSTNVASPSPGASPSPVASPSPTVSPRPPKPSPTPCASPSASASPTAPPAANPPFQGIVSALKAGTSFTLTPPADAEKAPPPLTVLITATTKVVGQGNQSATLANGLSVTVTGKLDEIKKTVTADCVQIVPAPTAAPPILGVVQSINAAALTFTVTPPPPPPGGKSGSGGSPGALTVKTSASTTFARKGQNGSADTSATFADLKDLAGVQITGSLDKDTNTVTATRVEILPPPK